MLDKVAATETTKRARRADDERRVARSCRKATERTRVRMGDAARSETWNCVRGSESERAKVESEREKGEEDVRGPG